MVMLDIEQSSTLVAATSPDIVIVVDHLPQQTGTLPMPSDIFQSSRKSSNDASCCNPSSDAVPKEDKFFHLLWKVAPVLVLCAVLMCIVLAVYLLYTVFPHDVIIQVVAGACGLLFFVIIVVRIYIKKSKKVVPVDADEILMQIQRDRL
ncbi:hypothetical protein HNY73_022697 [Argiope bruennichi]|uniref:Uncharacterized protein n=1 Tax=Argiope bruennichi TaxID=94029 RepID=A0A8T0E5B8_ARGBR|nr:hypothetical protein HNY73_022697 [Argiope bruennichi]